MSEFARLEATLAKLRQKERAPGEGRALRGSDPDALLAALVTEIDETILPRRLSFALPDGDVHLAVANRRLQALLGPAPKRVPSELVDHALPDVEDPMVTMLGETLKSMMAEAGEVPVRSMRSKKGFASDIGVPAMQLARAWSIAEPVERSPSETLQTFLDGINEPTAGWLRIEGEEVTAQGGAEGAATALGEQAAIFLDGYFGKFDVAFREPALSCGTLIAAASSDKHAIFFIEIGELSAFVTAPGNKILAIATDWQKLVAS
ncbi:MAG: hypothetical protein QNJ20_18580 [Paracoccaceae bacterium]|nr:hypothetical protein [Paracoccaceae bacterium]